MSLFLLIFDSIFSKWYASIAWRTGRRAQTEVSTVPRARETRPSMRLQREAEGLAKGPAQASASVPSVPLPTVQIESSEQDMRVAGIKLWGRQQIQESLVSLLTSSRFPKAWWALQNSQASSPPSSICKLASTPDQSLQPSSWLVGLSPPLSTAHAPTCLVFSPFFIYLISL